MRASGNLFTGYTQRRRKAIAHSPSVMHFRVQRDGLINSMVRYPSLEADSDQAGHFVYDPEVHYRAQGITPRYTVPSW
jgi:hypothetical protein